MTDNRMGDGSRKRPWAGRRGSGRMSTLLLMAVMIAGYLAVEIGFMVPACSEPDTAGYLWMADHFAAGRLPRVCDDDPFRYQSHVYVETATGAVAAKYPPGLPLAMALGMRLAGEAGAFAVSPLSGVMALIGACLLFRLWMSPGVALVAVLALAINPFFLVYTGYPLAHALDLALGVWGMYFLWCWGRTAAPGCALGAGLALGAAVPVRPTSALLALVALIMAVSVCQRHHTTKGRVYAGLLLLGVAYLAAPLAYAVYNRAIFGSPFITGYALSREQAAFSLSGLADSASWTLHGLAETVGLPIFGLGLFAMLTARGTAEKLLRCAWWVPTWLLYASYYWSDRSMQASFLRFYIGVIPVFIGSAFAQVDRLRLPGRQRFGIMGALIGALLILHAGEAYTQLRGVVGGDAARLQKQAAGRAARHLPAGSVIFAQMPAACRIGPATTFTLYDLSAFHAGHPMQHGRHPPREQPVRLERRRAFYAEQGPRLQVHLNTRIDQAWADGRTVAFIIPAAWRADAARRLGRNRTLVPLDVWDPVPPVGRQAERWGLYRVEEVLAPAP